MPRVTTHYDKALKYFEKALAICEEVGHIADIERASRVS